MKHCFSLSTLAFTGLLGAAFAQTANDSGRPGRAGRDATFESHVIVRGDRELLTFETEEGLQKLESLYEKNRAPSPGEYAMQYYRAHTDDSVQTYSLWLPPSYVPKKKFALLIQLHGIGPEVAAGQRQTWQGQGTAEWIDTNQPVIVAHPFGRKNAFYQGIAEEDVLQVIAEIEQHYSVDLDRVFIMGHSMGGAGSYTVGLHFPDKFGSITPIDPAMWTPEDGEADLPEWARPQAAIVRAPNLFPNAHNLPVFFKNAGAGIQRASTKFSDGIVAAGGFATMESFPGMPHHFAPQMSYSMFEAQATLMPIQRQPPTVKFYTTTLRYNQAYWVTLDQLEQHNRDTTITATYDDGKPSVQPRRPGVPPPPAAPSRAPSLAVTTSNLAAFSLQLGTLPSPADSAVALPIKIDDREVITLNGALPTEIHFAKSANGWSRVEAAAVLAAGKRHGMQGPIGDVFNERFLAVYGDGDRDLAIAELDAVRNPPGQSIIHGEFPMKAAAKITAEDIASSNLILFGTPATNPVLRRLAPRLPAALMGDGTGNPGVVFIYPNPENPARYVVVWTTKLLSILNAAPKLGYIQPVNLLPDYVRVKDGAILSAGHFDNTWQFAATGAQ